MSKSKANGPPQARDDVILSGRVATLEVLDRRTHARTGSQGPRKSGVDVGPNRWQGDRRHGRQRAQRKAVNEKPCMRVLRRAHTKARARVEQAVRVEATPAVSQPHAARAEQGRGQEEVAGEVTRTREGTYASDGDDQLEGIYKARSG